MKLLPFLFSTCHLQSSKTNSKINVYSSDCDPSNPIHRIRFGLNTNCNQKKPVWYIANVPTTDSDDYNDEGYLEFQEHYEQQRRYTWLYNFLRTLLWVTL